MRDAGMYAAHDSREARIYTYPARCPGPNSSMRASPLRSDPTRPRRTTATSSSAWRRQSISRASISRMPTYCPRARCWRWRRSTGDVRPQSTHGRWRRRAGPCGRRIPL